MHQSIRFRSPFVKQKGTYGALLFYNFGKYLSICAENQVPKGAANAKITGCVFVVVQVVVFPKPPQCIVWRAKRMNAIMCKQIGGIAPNKACIKRIAQGAQQKEES